MAPQSRSLQAELAHGAEYNPMVQRQKVATSCGLPPLEDGGVVGGENTAIDGNVFYSGTQYNPRFNNAIIMGGDSTTLNLKKTQVQTVTLYAAIYKPAKNFGDVATFPCSHSVCTMQLNTITSTE